MDRDRVLLLSTVAIPLADSGGSPGYRLGDLRGILTRVTATDPTALLEQARAGDGAALNALLKTLQPQIYRFGMKMCRHPQDAEDVLQDTMLTLARSFRDFRGASSVSTWLYTVARSFCIKKRRKGKFAPRAHESLDGLDASTSGALKSPDPDPHESAESRELREQVQGAIASLDPTYREVLVLRDVEGLTANEVAEVVGISVAAVKSRLHRARTDLRELLAPAANQPRPGCPDIRTIFSRHLEGELASDICATMEAHVATCPACATECDALTASLDICRSTPCDGPSGACLERIDEALRKALLEMPA